MRTRLAILFALTAITLVILYFLKPTHDEKLSEELRGVYCQDRKTIELRDTTASFFDRGNLQAVLGFSPDHGNYGWRLDTEKSVQLSGENGDLASVFVFGESTRMLRIDEQGSLLVPKAGGGATAFERCRANP
jgi:hypothetical protein